MRIKKNIAGFEKKKSINYNTSVTATKGEKAVIWISLIIYVVMLLVSVFVFKNITVTIITMIVGIFVIMGLMVFCVFRPLHKEERKRNTRLIKATIDRSYNNITGEFKDNSKIEEIKK